MPRELQIHGRKAKGVLEVVDISRRFREVIAPLILVGLIVGNSLGAKGRSYDPADIDLQCRR